MSQQRKTISTDEMLARRRESIGEVWVPQEPFFNTQAVRDTIRHFVNGIGDRNPLYRDPEYARKTRYGRLTAPGCFLYSIFHPRPGGGGLGGAENETGGAGGGGLAGTEWEWLLPIMEGDEFTFTNKNIGFEEKRSSAGRRNIVSSSVVEYKNQRGQVVARARGWMVGIDWGDAKPKETYRPRTEKAKYTPEELKKIYADYDKEVIRGATPRYWEDVQIGEELPHVIKGPLSVRDIIMWVIGGGTPWMRAHGLYVDYAKRHPGIGRLNKATGEVDVAELCHFLDTYAHDVQGASRAYDYGIQRLAWFGHLLTNWVGDDGFVKRSYAELRRHNYIGDTVWIRGKVTRKYLDDNGEPCVDIDCRGENQLGEIIMPGSATVILPSREKSTSPLDKRLLQHENSSGRNPQSFSKWNR